MSAPSINRWLMAKEIEGRSDRTIEYYRTTGDRLADFLGRDPIDATTDEIRSFLASFKATCSNVTIHNHRRNLNSYYCFLEDEDEIVKSPMRRIHYIKESKRVKLPFSDDELELIRQNTNGLEETAIVTFLISTGCRVGEVVSVLRDDADLKEKEVKVCGKGDKERVVFLDADAKISLERYLATRDDDCEYLFAKRCDGIVEKYTVKEIEQMMRKIGRRAKVEHVHPHRFRRTFATRAIEHGMPIEQVRDLLGHVNIATTLIYAVVSHESARAAHKRYLS